MPAAHIVLLAALVIAAWIDLRRRQIPNAVLYPAILLCLVAAILSGGSEGFLDALTGLAVCGGLLLVPWMSGALGGGDVKLAALLGAALGWVDGLHCLMWTLTLAAVWMLSAVIWNDGPSGAWRALRPQPLPASTVQPLPPEARPMYLAPAALAAAILVTWP